MEKKRLLVITTKTDLSVPFFSTKKLKDLYEIQVILIDDIISQQAPSDDYDTLYIRDLFNDSSIHLGHIRETLDNFINQNTFNSAVDKVSCYEDLLIEDKWNQYKIFSDFMPTTKLLSEYRNEFENNLIVKKRISSRAKDIHFSVDDVSESRDKYIVQNRLTIKKEYRVMGINGIVLEDAVVKESKTEELKVRIIESYKLPLNIKQFAENLISKKYFDLVGYDIAEANNGEIFLIEANRSPQINRYCEITKINPFELLSD